MATVVQQARRADTGAAGVVLLGLQPLHAGTVLVEGRAPRANPVAHF